MTSGGKRYPAKADLGAGQRQGCWRDLAPVSVTDTPTTNATVPSARPSKVACGLADRVTGSLTGNSLRVFPDCGEGLAKLRACASIEASGECVDTGHERPRDDGWAVAVARAHDLSNFDEDLFGSSRATDALFMGDGGRIGSAPLS
jgi:hypothetical protein